MSINGFCPRGVPPNDLADILPVEAFDIALPGRRGGRSDARGALSESESDELEESALRVRVENPPWPRCVAAFFAVASRGSPGFEWMEESRTCRDARLY